MAVLDERVAAYGHDDRVGAAAFGLSKDPLDHVFRAGVDGVA